MVDLIPEEGIVWDPEPPVDSEEFVSRLKEGSPFKPGQVLPNWWVFMVKRICDVSCLTLFKSSLLTDWIGSSIRL